MDEAFGNIENRGDRMKRAESVKCGCQKHSVLLEKQPGNGGGLHCSRRHGTKGSACTATVGINTENPHPRVSLPPSVGGFCPAKALPKETSRSAETVRAAVEID